MISTTLNSCKCKSIGYVRLYLSQFYKNKNGVYYSMPFEVPTETLKLSTDMDTRREQLKSELVKANRKCQCEKCNPKTI